MSNNSYVPPFLRNKQVTIEQATTEQPTTMDRKNPFQRERRAPRRPYVKPFWQIEQEKEQLEIDEKKKAAESGLEKTIENFPTLGGNTGMAPSSIWSSSRKFSELASEWKSADDQQKEEEDREKNRETDSKREDNFQLPRFQNMRRFAEPEDEYYEDADEPEEKVEEAEEEKWTVVDHHKYRKPKPEIDYSAEYLENDDEDGGDGTVWGAPEEYETCWDHPAR